MKLTYENCPAARALDPSLLSERPAFLDYEPNLTKLSETVSRFERYRNLIVVAHGGSLTSFYGFYHALRSRSLKNVAFLSTEDPDYIFSLKQRFAPSDTVVLSISKSGTNTGQLEEMAPFLDYPTVVVTELGTPLSALASGLNLEVVNHPPIGGRFTGFTEVALLPAAFCGFDVEGFLDGRRELFSRYAETNEAMEAASVLWQCEQAGYVDVLLANYSHRLNPMSAAVVQLCHESFGKGALGQTYIAHEGPEVQHHTLQRFLGGRKNMVGWFTTVANFDHPTPNGFPKTVHGVPVRTGTLGDISGVSLEAAQGFEAAGTFEAARNLGLPVVGQEVERIAERQLGEYLAFWQLYAVYASLYRGVNPFDQPAVESSKNLSFELRRRSLSGISR